MIISLDATNLLCPMPVIRVQEKIATLNVGDVLEVFATDPGTQYDIPAWCDVHGHKLVSIEQTEDAQIKLTIQVQG